MKEFYLQKLPKWYKNDSESDLVLSDDLDSLITVNVLQKVKKNWSVKYFYDFKGVYISPEIYFKEYKAQNRIWCDVSVVNGERCFDNHVNRLNSNDYINPNAINPNLITNVTNRNYTDKYCGSSALLAWSIYNLPLPKSEEGKMLLLAIDSTFLGYYSDKFRSRNRFYLCDVLGLEELYAVEQRHSKQDFFNIIDKYEIKQKISYNNENKQLETDLDYRTIGRVLEMDLDFPETKFEVWRILKTCQGDVSNFNNIRDLNKRLVTIAFTRRNIAKGSILVPKSK